MDLAVYIGELLRQYGALNVPGLGTFSQVRRDGYFNDNTGIYYPPRYETGFTEQTDDDNTLAQYISSKKNISINSARYFIHKYVSSLRLQAAGQETAMDHLGWIRLDAGSAPAFRPNAGADTYEQEFYGLPPVRADKIWNQLSASRKQVRPAAVAAVAESPAEPPVHEPAPELSIFPEVLNLKQETAAPVKNQPADAVYTEEDADDIVTKKTVNLWLILLIIITAAALALLGIYRYKPALFNRLTNRPGNITNQAKSMKHRAAAPVSPAKLPDTMSKALAARADSTKKTTDTAVTKMPAPQTAAPVAANTPAAAAAPGTQQFEIMGGAFATTHEADKAIANYKSLGIQARVLESAPGRSIKLTVGSYNTYDEAKAQLQRLLAAKKIIKDAYVLRSKTKNK